VDSIKKNKKLSITNPSMTRFLLPLQEAVNLVLFALTYGENGDMYVRKAPACTVEVLAKALCKIFNHKVGFEVVGNRAGEKMHETLVSSEELLRAEDLNEYYKIPPESQGLDYDKYLFRGDYKKVYKDIQPFTSRNTSQLNVEETRKLLLTLPEIQQDLRDLEK
jgi:UDP-glucose 4-epimerase